MNLENKIPNDWVKTSIGEVVELAQGVAINKKTDFVLCDESKGVPLLKINNLVNNTVDHYVDLKLVPQKTILEKDDVIFTRTGQVGWVFTNKFGVLHNNSFKVIPNDKLNKKFLYWFLKQKSIYNYVQKVASGSAQPDLNHGAFKTIDILLPSNIEEQVAIAKTLTAFDDKIENLQAQNNTLETTAQTIFKEWFGKYQIGDELPEGWRVGKLNEFISESLGGDYGKEKLLDDYTEETLCLRGTDLPDMKMGVPEKAPRRFLKKSKLERCKLVYGDIVIEISGGTENQSTGRVAYINEQILNKSDLPMTCVNFCRILRPNNPENSYFIYSLFEYLYNRKVLFNWENGTTGIKNLNLKALLNGFDLLLPKSDEKIIEFNQFIKSSFVKIQENNNQIQTLKKTRDTLLPKLMNGELRVKI
ncbi:restriction endonuclease subunit S [Tenacibaculum finnmarkense]|uniref:restriction endonuclease subunit S n=1 Tax=Tenacibaculum finnmarkense TaxID=2781243 RepID=UPI001E324C70|nr:restriction endonuclease subunit S [Tenacibaculum finnmarkense]MCD8448014.1 restriction endonuclease subunit S [Tenacibaculum finnmarkense genomovar finnmarkense]